MTSGDSVQQGWRPIRLRAIFINYLFADAAWLTLAKTPFEFMKIIAGLKAAAKSLAAQPKAESFRVAGKQIECLQCENILFHKKKASLNTARSSLSNTEWYDHEACILVCASCSHIEWFYDDIVSDKNA
jgi:hypothetical protein